MTSPRSRQSQYAYTTITDELKSHPHIDHSDELPYPSPVPDDLDPSRAAIEREALRRELLIAPFNLDPTAGECGIGNLPTATILSVHADLRRARCGYQLHVLKTNGLRDLIVETRDQCSLGNLSDVYLYDDISNLPVEFGGIDIVLRVPSTDTRAWCTSILIRG